MSDIDLELPERMWIGRHRAGISEREVAEALKMGKYGYRAIMKWESGESDPTGKHEKDAARLYEERGGVRQVWIRTGDGPMMIPDEEARPLLVIRDGS